MELEVDWLDVLEGVRGNNCQLDEGLIYDVSLPEFETFFIRLKRVKLIKLCCAPRNKLCDTLIVTS